MADVITEELGGLTVQRVIGVRLVEEVDETVNHRIDVQDGLPIRTEDIQTHIALLWLWWLMMMD